MRNVLHYGEKFEKSPDRENEISVPDSGVVKLVTDLFAHLQLTLAN